MARGLLQGADEMRLRQLEAKVVALESRSEAAPPGRAPIPPVAISVEELKEQRAERLKWHQDAVDRHWKEPDDPSFSTEATKILETDLAAAAAKAGFRVVKVDCRRESCVAVTEWQNFEAAERGWGAVLNHHYHVPCGITVALQETTNPAARYQNSVLFQCDLAYRHRDLQDGATRPEARTALFGGVR